LRRIRKSGPADLPTGAGRRFARLALAGAGVAGRAALGELRKLGAGSEERQGIDDATREANAEQVFAALAELRGPFLKLGQLLAQQGHELPEPWVRRLTALQRSAPPMHGALVRVQIRSVLDRPPEELFDVFEREPFAAASLGQVHRARRGGAELAVKVQYPGIERAIQSDFALHRGRRISCS
jgi:aarF domain-containing kinase